MQPADIVLAQLFEDSRYFVYDRDDVVLRAGDVPSGVYLITSGWIKVYSLCDDGEMNIIMNLSDGDVFPLDWAVSGRLHDVTFAALETTTLQRIPRETFARIHRNSPQVSAAASAKLASYLNRLSHELEYMAYRSARERVAFRLISLAERFGEKQAEQLLVRVRVSNEYIARSTNMTRETASREMSRLARKGLIGHQDGRIVINDVAGLRREVGKSFAASMDTP